jgi:Deuterolysin metalloprotease (M35) family
MRFFKNLTAGLSAMSLATRAMAAPGKPAALDVKISPAGPTIVKATITNVGGKDLKLLREGTVLDKGPVKKFAIKSSSKPARVS